MTSGSKICALLLIGLLSLPTWATESAPEAQALIASLGRPAPARTAFAEARFMKLLDRPLVVSGELAWLGDDQLQRTVTAPRAERFTIADGEVTQERAGHAPRHFSLKHAPQLQGLLDSFVALLSGNPERLAESFLIERSGLDAGRWTLTLTPRDPRVASKVASIRIDGQADEPRCMVMQEADGDVAIDLLGPLAAKMPADPTRDALAALCQQPAS
ncbi:MAG TPA: LolA-related protein [Dyella sp.]|nr:LolA-related protein [Dyella sp.]